MFNFQKIKPVETADEYIDVAFRRAKNYASERKRTIKPNRDYPLDQPKRVEKMRFDTVCISLVERFKRTAKSFPDRHGLPAFYQELMDATLDVKKFEDSIDKVDWAIGKIEHFGHGYVQKMVRVSTNEALHAVRREFYGRIASVVKNASDALLYLEKVRKVMKQYPLLREIPTVAIAGFPNVGKTTLLSKISSSKPEIAEYAFTTKHINVGYHFFGSQEIQILDTPGTLARPDKMNAIEKQAYLALKHLAHVIVYVFDPTEPYPLPDQEMLLELVRAYKKPVLLYMSKNDIAKPIQIEKLKNYESHELITDSTLLLERLSALLCSLQ